MQDPGGIEILLVEDNPNDAEMAIRAFQKSRVANRVHHVEDGAQALDYLFATGAYASRRGLPGPRLVLLDLKLPKVDGLEVLRRLKEAPQTRMTPVVVMTSSREEQDLIGSYRLGVNSYIVKPVDLIHRSHRKPGLLLAVDERAATPGESVAFSTVGTIRRRGALMAARN